MANLALCTVAMQARADCRAPLNRGMGRSTRATHLSSRNVAQRVFWGKKKEEPAPQAAGEQPAGLSDAAMSVRGSC